MNVIESFDIKICLNLCLYIKECNQYKKVYGNCDVKYLIHRPLEEAIATPTCDNFVTNFPFNLPNG